MIKIIQWLKRNACKECDYYCPENNICQSKKVITCGCHSYVNWFNRHFCKANKAKPFPERKFEEIVVEYPPAELCTYPEYRGKPYFSIKYQENGEHIIGFGTYNPKVLSSYLRLYFMEVENDSN